MVPFEARVKVKNDMVHLYTQAKYGLEMWSIQKNLPRLVKRNLKKMRSMDDELIGLTKLAWEVADLSPHLSDYIKNNRAM
jgi:hypothetical protein